MHPASRRPRVPAHTKKRIPMKTENREVAFVPPSELPVDDGPVGTTFWVRHELQEDGSVATHRVTLMPRFLRILEKTARQRPPEGYVLQGSDDDRRMRETVERGEGTPG